MKKIEKFILPGLVVVIFALLYFFYFAPSDELGSFANFDKDSKTRPIEAVTVFNLNLSFRWCPWFHLFLCVTSVTYETPL